MSKTIENQVSKTTALAEGMKKHLDELVRFGVNEEVLNSLIALGEEVVERSREVDELRMQASEKAHETNIRMVEVREKYKELKTILRNNYPIEEWSRFGLMDKR